MSDKKLNESKIVKDMDYVLVTLADGSVGQIAKSDLASVVAGVMGSNKLFPFMYKGIANSDLNNVTEPGSYRLGGDSFKNGPAATIYGSLVVFKDSYSYCTQVLYDLSKNIPIAWTRLGAYTQNSWTPWQRLDNFGYNSLKELAGGVASEISPLTYLGYFNNETPYDSILKSGYGFSTPDDGSGILGHFIIMVYASSKAVIKIGISGNCKIRATELKGEWSEWKLL